MNLTREAINGLPADTKMNLFNGLAQALGYPDAELVQRLRSGEYASQMAEALNTLGHEALSRQMLALGEDYATSTLSAENQLLDLEKAYTWMCFASKPRQVSLFESVYKEGKLLQESTFEIARLYYEAGVTVDEAFKLPPDHIAVELEFMAYLCHNEVVCGNATDLEREQYARSLQRTVLENHLGHFAFKFGEKLGLHAPKGFYRKIAQILMGLFAEFNDKPMMLTDPVPETDREPIQLR